MREKYFPSALFFILIVVLASLALGNGYPLTITSFETKDIDGNPATTFRKGEVVVVETEIEYPAEEYYYYAPPGGMAYLQLVGFYYQDRMMGLLLTRGVIASGETKSFGGGVQIRTTDPSGKYKISVFIWNGFPSEVGAAWQPLAEKQTKEITVTP